MEQGVTQLIALFDELFATSYNTRLVAGSGEPIYLPADAQTPYNQVVFAHGYFASALHEVAHWCVAGAERRLCEDFGYWYRPDGRTSAQQSEFEQVEVKPQALEWIFTLASKRQFYASADNLSGDAHDDSRFRFAVAKQARQYMQQGLPERDATWAYTLQQEFGGEWAMANFSWPDEPLASLSLK